jgi:hypothetical protein
MLIGMGVTSQHLVSRPASSGQIIKSHSCRRAVQLTSDEMPMSTAPVF